jgi:hypothetical protein
MPDRNSPVPSTFFLADSTQGDQRCRVTTNRNTPASRSARPTTSPKARRSAAGPRERPSVAPGRPSTRTTTAAASARAAQVKTTRPDTRRREGRRGCRSPADQHVVGSRQSQKRGRQRESGIPNITPDQTEQEVTWLRHRDSRGKVMGSTSKRTPCVGCS